jgi:hypothetical protein
LVVVEFYVVFDVFDFYDVLGGLGLRKDGGVVIDLLW